MIVMKATELGATIIILEKANIEKMMAGFPAVTPDKLVTVLYTPDLPWLAKQLIGSGGDLAKINAMIQESMQRPHNPTPPGAPGLTEKRFT